MARPELDAADERRLSGQDGEACRFAMRVLHAMAKANGARRFIDVRSAHVDGCLYQGQVSLDFEERLADGGAHVVVPTTLNVGSLDLLHPELYRGPAQTARAARRLMNLYVSMGCSPTWTCAPYQLPGRRPAFGEHVAWAESNAIVFANSVLGARTDRYGDFIDICAALAGRVPESGLHLTENRRGQIVFRIGAIPPKLLDEDVLYPVLGYLLGSRAGTGVPVLQGLPPSTSEDRLKALGAAAASSGSVGLFHAVGVTPEAPTLDDALQGADPIEVVDVTPAMLRAARDSLSTSSGPAIDAVSLGTPHLSLSEFERLTPLLERARPHPDVDVFVSTSAAILAEVEARGWHPVYERAGVTLVVGTCTYVTPMLRARDRVVMTNSAKWAHYAPANVGVDVVFGSLEECVRSAEQGRVWRDPVLWADD
ncbi:MAG TPA: aconitase X catalytic domain-containing protein [Actinomycetota bacterium]